MADKTKAGEATWQHPEHKGRGGQANPPGDQGQDRQHADGTPQEREGWGREERESGWDHITRRNVENAKPKGDPTPNHKTQSGTQLYGGGTQGLDQGPPPTPERDPGK